LLEIISNEPFIDCHSIITVTSDPSILTQYQHFDPPPSQPLPSIPHVPQVKCIKPISKKSCPQDALDDSYYLKRHRRHEKEEKTQKNREKERLKHGYYQQKQLVERIKTMEKSLLQSIVSSIRHRSTTQTEDWDEDAYLDDLHCRLLNDAVELLRRYEVLGLNTNKQGIVQHQQQEEEHEAVDTASPTLAPSNSETTLFHQAVQSEAIKQRSRQIKSFSKQPIFAGDDSPTKGSRRSTRHIIAFGQKLPDFELQEYHLPHDILIETKRSKK
jgi:hypothetical protein